MPGYGDLLKAKHVEFKKGSKAEFDRLMRLFILTDPVVARSQGYPIWVQCETPGLEAKLMRTGNWSPRLEELMKLLFQYHVPFVPAEYARYDGAGRAVNLVYWPDELFENLLPREEMNLVGELKEWLASIGENTGRFGLIQVGEKIL